MLILWVFVLTYFYAHINIHNKMYQIIKCITHETHKNMRSTTNHHDNFQNKQEHCICKTIYITNHSKNENHVKNAWKLRWTSQFLLKVLHNTITHYSCYLSALLFRKLLLCLWSLVCRIFCFCKTRLFIVLIVMIFLGILVCIIAPVLCVCMFVFFTFFVYDLLSVCCAVQTM